MVELAGRWSPPRRRSKPFVDGVNEFNDTGSSASGFEGLAAVAAARSDSPRGGGWPRRTGCVRRASPTGTCIEPMSTAYGALLLRAVDGMSGEPAECRGPVVDTGSTGHGGVGQRGVVRQVWIGDGRDRAATIVMRSLCRAVSVMVKAVAAPEERVGTVEVTTPPRFRPPGVLTILTPSPTPTPSSAALIGNERTVLQSGTTDPDVRGPAASAARPSECCRGRTLRLR